MYNGTTGTSVTGSAFTGAPVSYSYTLDTAANVPSLVQSNAGPK